MGRRVDKSGEMMEDKKTSENHKLENVMIGSLVLGFDKQQPSLAK